MRRYQHFPGLRPCGKLGALVESASRTALKALETRDLELSRKVRDGDRVIDRMDHEIKAEAASILARRAPAACDLRTVLAAMVMSMHLERCGDYATNIAKRTTILANAAPIGDTVAALLRMGRLVEAMLADALDAFIRRDPHKAEDVRLALSFPAAPPRQRGSAPGRAARDLAPRP